MERLREARLVTDPGVAVGVTLPDDIIAVGELTFARESQAGTSFGMLSQAGKPFWQEESYDHLVRNGRELERIRNYIEENPVRAGLVRNACEYRWSSAGWATRGSPADEGVRPT